MYTFTEGQTIYLINRRSKLTRLKIRKVRLTHYFSALDAIECNECMQKSGWGKKVKKKKKGGGSKGGHMRRYVQMR